MTLDELKLEVYMALKVNEVMWGRNPSYPSSLNNSEKEK